MVGYNMDFIVKVVNFEDVVQKNIMDLELYVSNKDITVEMFQVQEVIAQLKDLNVDVKEVRDSFNMVEIVFKEVVVTYVNKVITIKEEVNEEKEGFLDQPPSKVPRADGGRQEDLERAFEKTMMESVMKQNVKMIINRMRTCGDS